MDDKLEFLILRNAKADRSERIEGYSADEVRAAKIVLYNQGLIIGDPLHGDDELKTVQITGLTRTGESRLRELETKFTND